MPTGRTQNRTETDWVDTGRTQIDPVEDFDEKEQRKLPSKHKVARIQNKELNNAQNH